MLPPVGAGEIAALLARHYLRCQPSQLDALIEAGRTKGLTIAGTYEFVRHKLEQKINSGDPVYSVKLLIKAVGDDSDLHHWLRAASLSSYSYFHGGHASGPVPFSVEDVYTYVSGNVAQLRNVGGYDDIAIELESLVRNTSQCRVLERLDQVLLSLENRLFEIARSRLSENDIRQMQCELETLIGPYQGKMREEEFAKLEQQCCLRRVLDRFELPHLSLFYLRQR